mmetsp:Transcript_33309/g.48898  ORF Transcript_33309/g.48898 Transcript_33309/m.48898 type:complete len:83 (+) Transcript_33309:113-361(+)
MLEPYSSELDDITNQEKDVVQFRHASKAAIDDAMEGGDDAENLFRFKSMWVGGSDPRHSLQPSGKQNHSTLGGSATRRPCLM